MKTVALISGGKDSCYNMLECVRHGHQIVALANLYPDGSQDELDSYMFQTVGHQAIHLYADAMNLPLYRHPLKGSSIATDRYYSPTAKDEVEDLYELLKEVQNDIEIEAVSVGAILSNYQRVRVENVCSRLGLVSLAYLWQRDQQDLLMEMIDDGIDARIIKVAALGLEPQKHLGKSLQEIAPVMRRFNQKYGLNICGEGGEYETFTLDCPLFTQKIIIDRQEILIHSDDAFAPVGYLRFQEMHLQAKDGIPQPVVSAQENPWATAVANLRKCCEISTNNYLESEYHELRAVESDVNVMNCSFPALKSCGCYHYVHGLKSDIRGTASEETQRVMELLINILQKQNLNLDDILFVNLYTSDMREFGSINLTYKKFFNLNPPARACIEVELMDAKLSLECLIFKYLADSSFTSKDDNSELNAIHDVLHVQSISHWAPANIGPYSQAHRLRNTIFVAGQIGLVPGSMKLIIGDIRDEGVASLYNTNQILGKIDSDVSLADVVFAICYVTKSGYMRIAREIWIFMQEKYLKDVDIDKATCPMVIVVIPDLPKNANIEWQIIACREGNYRMKLVLDSKIEPFKIITKSYMHDYNKSCLYLSSLYFNGEKDSGTCTFDIRKITSALYRQLHSALQQSHRSWQQILCVKIFYNKSEIDEQEKSIQLGIKDFFQETDKTDASNVCTTIIPVLDLENYAIITVYCQIFD